MKLRKTFIHDSADVHPSAKIGDGVLIWNWCKVREGASIGAGSNLGQGVYVDINTRVGVRCKLQNGVYIYSGVTLGDDVFVGPNVTFTNDRIPRAHPPWQVTETVVENGASVGANATIVCGVRLGRHCMVAAGAVVTRDVPDFGLVMGTPARLVDYISVSGKRARWKEGEPLPDPSKLLDKTLGFEGREDLSG